MTATKITHAKEKNVREREGEKKQEKEERKVAKRKRIKIGQFKNHRPLTAYRSHTMCGIRGAQRSKSGTHTHTHARLRMAVTVADVGKKKTALTLPAVAPEQDAEGRIRVRCVNLHIK